MDEVLEFLPLDEDDLEWDANDPAGSEEDYEVIDFAEYDHSDFTSVHDREVISLAEFELRRSR